jgi:gamma-glutamyl-gamma-aminobutyrate hydrolase PuuD
MAPIIGIAPCRTVADYVEAVRRAGGEPRVLDPGTQRPLELITKIDGLLLTGGFDVDPALYGQAAHPSTKMVPAERDRFELELARCAIDADLPFLGICRGQQVMNVAGGGTLIQDIPTEVTGALTHSIDAPLNASAHEVWISRDSRLWTAMQDQLEDGETYQVNSRHHQAVDRLGEGFDVSATAPDGVIEAIEQPKLRFCIGVQWHPENFWRTGEFRSLFESFVAACEQK